MDKERLSSTPFGPRILPNLPWSEIRGVNKVKKVCPASAVKRSKSKQQPVINIQKKCQTKTNEVDDCNSNSDYETVSEAEIDAASNSSRNYHWFENFTDLKSLDVIDENSPYNDSQSSFKPLFDPPNEKKYDDYEKFYLDAERDSTRSTFLDILTSSPELQMRFEDTSDLKTYSNRHRRNQRLNPSQVSFSPKWENKIASKYNSPTNIPIRNRIQNANSTTSPVVTGFSSRSMSYSMADHLWDSFIQSWSPSTKQKIEKELVVQQPGSKYSHLRVSNEQFKIFKSPNRGRAESDEENTAEGWSCSTQTAQRITTPLRERFSPNIEARKDNSSKVVIPNSSKSIAKKRIRSSFKYDTIKSAKQFESEQAFENNFEMPVFAETKANKSRADATLEKRLRPKIISSVTIKSPFKLIKF